MRFSQYGEQYDEHIVSTKAGRNKYIDSMWSEYCHNSCYNVAVRLSGYQQNLAIR